jgi:uncharacterized membrane protein YfcA
VIPAAIAVAAGAVAQAVTGLGFSLVSAPFLVAALGRAEGVRLNLLLSAALNLVMLAGERRQARWSAAMLLLVPAAIATPFFAWAFDRIDGRTLAIAAGLLTVASAGALAAGVRIRRAGGRAGAAVTGVVSAAMNVLAGIGGPPIAMFAVNAEWPSASVRPTLQAYFLGLNTIGIAVLGLPSLSFLPWTALLLGWLVGRVVVRRLPEGVARPLTLALAAVGGIVALARARA